MKLVNVMWPVLELMSNFYLIILSLLCNTQVHLIQSQFVNFTQTM